MEIIKKYDQYIKFFENKKEEDIKANLKKLEDMDLDIKVAYHMTNPDRVKKILEEGLVVSKKPKHNMKYFKNDNPDVEVDWETPVQLKYYGIIPTYFFLSQLYWGNILPDKNSKIFKIDISDLPLTCGIHDVECNAFYDGKDGKNEICKYDEKLWKEINFGDNNAEKIRNKIKHSNKIFDKYGMFDLDKRKFTKPGTIDTKLAILITESTTITQTIEPDRIQLLDPKDFEKIPKTLTI